MATISYADLIPLEWLIRIKVLINLQKLGNGKRVCRLEDLKIIKNIFVYKAWLKSDRSQRIPSV